jgi:hypothetical protein
MIESNILAWHRVEQQRRWLSRNWWMFVYIIFFWLLSLSFEYFSLWWNVSKIITPRRRARGEKKNFFIINCFVFFCLPSIFYMSYILPCIMWVTMCVPLLSNGRKKAQSGWMKLSLFGAANDAIHSSQQPSNRDVKTISILSTLVLAYLAQKSYFMFSHKKRGRKLLKLFESV